MNVDATTISSLICSSRPFPPVVVVIVDAADVADDDAIVVIVAESAGFSTTTDEVSVWTLLFFFISTGSISDKAPRISCRKKTSGWKNNLLSLQICIRKNYEAIHT